MIFHQIDAICKKYGCTLKTPIKDIPQEAIDDIINGTDERLRLDNETLSARYSFAYEGLAKYLEMQLEEDAGAAAKSGAASFSAGPSVRNAEGKG